MDPPRRQDSLELESAPAIALDKGKGRALQRSDTNLSELVAQIELEDNAPVEATDGGGSSSKAKPHAYTATAPSLQSGKAAHDTLDDSDLDHIHYETKVISFGASPVRIACQTTNGACPILSIVNFLALTSALSLPDRERISANSLTEVLTEYILSRDADVSVLQELNGLHRGLSVDPKFYSIDAVQDDGSIMAAFGCSLVHTWLPPRDDPAYHILTTQFDSFDKAQVQVLCNGADERSLAIQQFFDTYPTNTTPYGVSVLRNEMRESEMRILFLNSHFSLVYKHPVSGDLYTLVTDSGYIASGDDVVWESLDPLHIGNGQLYSADFIPRDVLGEGKNEDAFGQAVRSRSGADAVTRSDELLAHDLQRQEDEFQGRGAGPMSDEELARRLQRREERWADAVDQGQQQQQQHSRPAKSGGRKTNSQPKTSSSSAEATKNTSGKSSFGSKLKSLFGGGGGSSRTNTAST